MLTKTLAAAAALSMLVAGGEALAAQKKTPALTDAPKQPIPYSQLDAYAKASPKVRASKDWWAGSASTGQATTGMSTDTAASAPAAASNPAMSGMTPATPDTSVNPMPSAPPPSLPVTPPTDAAPPLEPK